MPRRYRASRRSGFWPSASLVVTLLVTLSALAVACGSEGPTALDRQGPGRVSYIGPGASGFGRGVHVVNPDGTGDSVLTPGTADVSWHAWSADGERFAYTDFARPGIHVVDRRQATTATLVPEYGAWDILYLSWSPGGERLLFAVNGIMVVNADGSGLRVLAGSIDSYSAPAWSPDGRRIVFTRPGTAPDFRQQLWVMNADGSAQRQIALTTPAMHPRWSPDGRSIAFDDGQSIWIVAAGGGAARAVLRAACTPSCGSADEYEYPKWSPDGTRLAGVQGSLVFVVSTDGRGLTLTDAGSTTYPDPQWAPNGEWISYVSSGPRGDDDVYVMRPDGSGRLRLTSSSTIDELPRWFR
jgi:Tol biopolymer transport system component